MKSGSVGVRLMDIAERAGMAGQATGPAHDVVAGFKVSLAGRDIVTRLNRYRIDWTGTEAGFVETGFARTSGGAFVQMRD